MGGRGSSGGVGGGGGVKMPTFTGSEKQIKFAKDIIAEGLETISRNIALEKRNGKNPSYKSEAKRRIKAWGEVKKTYTQTLAAGAGREVPAGRVIDRRGAFNSQGVFRMFEQQLRK